MIKAKDYCIRVFDGTHDTPKPCAFGYKLLTSKNILNGILDKTDAYYISEEDYNIINQRSKVNQWDILIYMIGTIKNVGSVCLVTDSEIDFAIKNMGVFSCKNEDKAKWLYYFLQSPYAKHLMKNYLNGAIQKFLPLEWLRNLEIPEYTSNHKEIVSLLWNIDSYITNNIRICSDLEAMAKLIYDYWFVQFDFPDQNGKPYKSNGGKMVWNEQLKREIPDGWAVKPLANVFEITMGSSPDGDSLNESHEGIEFYQGSTDFGYLYPTERVYTTAPVRFAKAQDVLMSVRAPVGAMNIAMNDCCIGRGLAAIHHESTLFAWCTMQTFQPYFDVFNGNGTTFGALTSDDLKQQLTVVPSDELIEGYSKKVESMGEKMRLLSLENQQLSALRDFLLPMLMNGQVKVNPT